jgi:hypothetical protein
VIVIPAAIGWSLLRRDTRALAPLAVLGFILVFAIAAWVTGKTGGWIRYYIALIPLTVLLGGYLVARGPTRPAVVPPVRSRLQRGLRITAATMVACLAVAGTAVALPTAWTTMRDPVLGRGEHNKLDDLPQYVVGGVISDYLDRMHLPDGSVLVDVFLGFPIVLESDRPRQFVITPDRDFVRVATDPQVFKVRYILVPPSDGLGQLDAIKRQWPGIYDTGATVADLVHEFDVPGTNASFRWRLYAVRMPS